MIIDINTQFSDVTDMNCTVNKGTKLLMYL